MANNIVFQLLDISENATLRRLSEERVNEVQGEVQEVINAAVSAVQEDANAVQEVVDIANGSVSSVRGGGPIRRPCRSLKFKVAKKTRGLTVYGLYKTRPVTLYKNQWRDLVSEDTRNELLQFIHSHDAELATYVCD